MAYIPNDFNGLAMHPAPMHDKFPNDFNGLGVHGPYMAFCKYTTRQLIALPFPLATSGPRSDYSRAMTQLHPTLLQRPAPRNHQSPALPPFQVERKGLIELARAAYRQAVLGGDERLASPASEDFKAQELASRGG